MIDIKNIYDKIPIPLQNLLVTAKGYLLKKERYDGNFSKYVSQLEKSQWLSEEELKRIQIDRLNKMLEHAYINVPYYRELFKRKNILPTDIKNKKDLKILPLLTKENIKRNSNSLIAENIPSKKMIPHKTGGTTGSPLTVYVTKKAIKHNYAFLEARCKRWSGVKSGDKLASFLGKVIVPISQKKPPFWRYNRAYNQVLFSSFHLNEENLHYYVEEFNRVKPKIVQGYVSTVFILAKFILDNNLQVYSPSSILLSSETLHDWKRKTIEKAFKTKIFNGYSLAEFVAFISECEEGRLHISPEYGLIELEEIKGSNHKYEIIATTLFNYSMPLIRYKTGDVVTISKENKCPCGRGLPIVGSIEGRKDNMLLTPEGNYISSASLSLVFKDIQNIKQAQIIQNKQDMITLRLATETDFSDEESNLLRNKLEKRLGKKMLINIQFVDEIERTSIGKYKFIISNI